MNRGVLTLSAIAAFGLALLPGDAISLPVASGGGGHGEVILKRVK